MAVLAFALGYVLARPMVEHLWMTRGGISSAGIRR